MKKVVDLVAFFRFDDVGGSLVERFSWHLELAAVGARYFDAGVCLISLLSKLAKSWTGRC